MEKLKDQAMRYEHSLGVSHLASDILEQLNAPQRRIAAALDKLNEEGQEKVATYAEDLVEMPKYQAQEPPQSPHRTRQRRRRVKIPPRQKFRRRGPRSRQRAVYSPSP